MVSRFNERTSFSFSSVFHSIATVHLVNINDEIKFNLYTQKKLYGFAETRFLIFLSFFRFESFFVFPRAYFMLNNFLLSIRS